MHFTKRAFLVSVLALINSLALADTVAVIGTGNVGMALGTEFASQGHTIIYGSRDPSGMKAQVLVEKTGKGASAMLPADAAEAADMVLLAVPGMVVESVARGLGDLTGKIVIDATNPLVMDEQMHVSYGVDTSNGEIVQAALPGAFVVKAFNTISWQQMIDPDSASGPLSVPLVGDDQASKDTVAEMVSKMGLDPIDLGPLEYARWTEFAAVVALNNEFSERENFDLLFRIID
jgi:predicted dinucleotide-binding enzyme